MRKLTAMVLLIFVSLCNLQAEENIRKVATWNMKWLGTNNGNQLDDVEMVTEYAKYIIKSEATLFALQEIGATHSVQGSPRCYYLDLIVEELNRITSNVWLYELDDRNESQRLAYLYNSKDWELRNAYCITPGGSFTYIRKPLVITVKAIGANCELEFVFINIHLKAFDDAQSREKRRNNFIELSSWLETTSLESDVLIAGDTNMYGGESDVDNSLEDIGYSALFDREKTCIHDYELGERFDRYFSSPDLMKEINSAKDKVGSVYWIDVIKENDDEFLHWFDDNISDHFPVVLHIDVSKER